jgi:excisionase family DNA binding protein
MPSAAIRKPVSAPVEQAMSIGGLAERLGIPRQRVYNLIRRKQIRAVPMSGGLVIPTEEANRILDAAVRVSTKEGRGRVVFDFV